MEIQTREFFRNEIKIITYRRKVSKERSRQLQKDAQRLLKQADPEMGWKDEKHQTAVNWFWAADNLKRNGAVDARHLNLAFGLLRGLTYKQIERSCYKKPSAEKIFETVQKFAQYSDKYIWTIEKIKAWLEA